MKQKLLLSVICVFFAFAASAQATRYVKQGGSGTKNGSSWLNASDNLQAMVNASSSGDQVWVAAGSYYRDNGDGNSFIMKEGVNVYGGFPATGTPTMADRTLPTAQTPANQTILDGQNGYPALRVLFQPAVFSIPTVWDGFVIQNGRKKQHGINPNLVGNGAGAYLRENGELRNCTIINNVIDF